MVMELENGSGNIAFAEHQNQQMVAARSNYVLSGLVVTAAGGSNLTTGADDIDVSAGYCFNNNTLRSFVSIGNLDLSTHYSGLSSGQSRFVFIYINTSGTLVSVAGTPAVTGQQLPPSIVDKTVVLAMITLTHLDTTVDAPDIEDWLIRNPVGSAMGDNEKSSWGDDGDLIMHHDNAHGYINNITGDLKFPTGKISLSSGTNINEFSIDTALGGGSPSDDAVPTEKAIKTYVDALTSPSLSDLTDVSMTGPQLEDITSFAAANTTWYPCTTYTYDTGEFNMYGVTGIGNAAAAVANPITFAAPTPTVKGGLKLYITGIRITLSVANGSNFVTSSAIYGVDSSDDNTIISGLIGTDNLVSPGTYVIPFSAVDVSDHHHISAVISIAATSTPGSIVIESVDIEGYYAA